MLNTTAYIDWRFSEFIIKKLENIESKELCKIYFKESENNSILVKVLQNSFHEKIPYYTLSRVLLEELVKKNVKIQEKENQHEKDIASFFKLKYPNVLK